MILYRNISYNFKCTCLKQRHYLHNFNPLYFIWGFVNMYSAKTNGFFIVILIIILNALICNQDTTFIVFHKEFCEYIFS